MKFFVTVFLFMFLFSCIREKNSTPTPISVDLSSDIVLPKQYIVTKATQQIVIDGIENEYSWKRATYSDLFIDIEGIKTPTYDTRMKMLWDEDYLYVYAELEEPHIWGDLKQRDTVIFYNNDFEVFISPSGSTRRYAEIEINALGTVWDLLLNKPYRDNGNPNNHWNLNQLKSAIQIQGTLNEYNDIDSMWTIEMAIPMNALLELKNNPKTLPTEGEQWRINFSRVEWDYDIVNGYYQRKRGKDDKFMPEYNWVWSSQNVINMHEPEKWGFIQFTNDSSSLNKAFIEDKNLEVKQVCFALFRQTKSGNLNELLNDTTGSSKTIYVNYSDKDSLTASFLKTNFGFEFIVNTKQADQVFIINEAGELKIR